MRIIYACRLEFSTDQSPALWPTIVEWWDSAFSRATGRSVDVDPNAEASIEGALVENSRTWLRVWRHEGAVLRELGWFAPDQYDRTLRWTTHLGLVEDSAGWLFEIRLHLSSNEFSITPAEFEAGTPRIVRSLVSTGAAMNGGIALKTTPIPIRRNDIEFLADMLFSPDRRIPIIVVTPDRDSGLPIVDADALASKLAGLALVMTVAGDATFALSEAIGKELGAYHGAIRVYWPGLRRDSEPRRHPLYLSWAIVDRKGPTAFTRFLVRQIFGVAAYRHVEADRIRRVHIEAQRAAAAAAAVASANRSFDEFVEEHVVLQERLDKALSEIDGLANENRNLRDNQVAFVGYQAVLNEDEDETDDEPEQDETVDGRKFKNVARAVSAAAADFPHVNFLPSAFDSADASPYMQPGKVYRLLSALASLAKRWSKEGDAFSWRASFADSGFHLREQISKTTQGKWGDEYTYIYKGNPTIFKDHVSLGVGMSPAKCLSMHYFRDEIAKKVIVGHVGRHKTNTKTN